MAAHSASSPVIQPVLPDQPQAAWAPWLREIAGAVNQLGTKTTELAAGGGGGTGPTGPAGPAGPAGATGAAGPAGATGATGPAGTTGATGPAGSANMSGMTAGQIPIAATATSVTSSIPTSTFLTPATAASTYAPLANPVLTGDPQAPTPATADNDTSIATTAFVKAQGYATTTAMNTADNLRVLKAGDAMTGSLTINPGSLFIGAGSVYTVDVRASITGNYLFAFVNSHNTAGDLGGFIAVGATGADTTSSLLAFTNGAISAVQGNITRNGAAAVLYGATSDRRLKDRIVDSQTGLETLMRLRVRDFNFRAEPGRTQQGLIAQELHEVYPVAVHVGSDDPMHPWSLDYGRLTPLLVRAIQQQQAQIEELRAEIAALR